MKTYSSTPIHHTTVSYDYLLIRNRFITTFSLAQEGKFFRQHTTSTHVKNHRNNFSREYYKVHKEFIDHIPAVSSIDRCHVKQHFVVVRYDCDIGGYNKWTSIPSDIGGYNPTLVQVDVNPSNSIQYHYTISHDNDVPFMRGKLLKKTCTKFFDLASIFQFFIYFHIFFQFF